LGMAKIVRMGISKIWTCDCVRWNCPGSSMNICPYYYDTVYGPAPAIGHIRLTCGAEVVKRQRAGEEAHRNRLDAFILSDAWGRNVPGGGAECSHSVYSSIWNLRHYRYLFLSIGPYCLLVSYIRLTTLHQDPHLFLYIISK